MTQEDKELLLKDLCARAPYKVQVLEDVDKEFDGGCIGEIKAIFCKDGHIYTYGSLTPMTIEEVRPYLRPMSSMTEEECIELGNIKATIENISEVILNAPYYIEVAYSKQIDWLNAHHFDYRGLIKKVLLLKHQKECINLK